MPQRIGVADHSACLEPIHPDEFVWALGSLCQLNRIPFDRALLLSQLPPPYDWSSLVQAATSLGFRCELSERAANTVESWAFPCVVFLRALRTDADGPPPGIELALAV